MSNFEVWGLTLVTYKKSLTPSAEIGKKNQANAIIHILHSQYQPKVIGHILKKGKRNLCQYLCVSIWNYMINHSENDDENEK